MVYKYSNARILLISLALTTLTSCHTGSLESLNKEKVFFLNFSAGSLESLDPAYAKDLYTMWTSHLIFNTLIEIDSNLLLVPSLARSWDVSQDGTLYTFHLRTDVYFHSHPLFNGTNTRLLTANDVVYSFNRLLDPTIASPGAWIFNHRVTKKEPFLALNDSTVCINLRLPFRPMLQLLTMSYCSIVPKTILEQNGNNFRRIPSGTGPFQIQAWDEGNALTLHSNKDYWEYDNQGVRLPYLEAVQISFYESKATEFFLFLQGKLDFVNGIDGSFKDVVLSKNGVLKPDFANKYNLSKSTYLNTEYIGILQDTTLLSEPLRNPLVRQAMNYAIDRKRIARYFRNGIGIAATNGFIPPGMPGADTTGSFGYNYNPMKARQLLSKAGYPNGQGISPITIYTPDTWADILNFIASQLQDVGIPASISTIQPNILRQQMSDSKVALFRAQWIADYPDAETYLVFFNSQQPAPPNYTRFSNATFDKWYEESISLPDSTRWKKYREMDSLVMAQAPIIPLFYDQLLHFTQRNISGFRSTSMNGIELKFVKKK